MRLHKPVCNSLAECAVLGNACGRASVQARGGIAGQLRAANLGDMPARQGLKPAGSAGENRLKPVDAL